MSNIKKLDEFFEMISEAFDNPLDIEWVDKGDILRGFFTVNDRIYQIVCENIGYDTWKYDFFFFKENKEFSIELTNIEKYKFRVLPTVESGIKYLFDNKNPNAIIFGAGDKSKGRKKLYDSFCKKFSEDNDLKFYTKIYTDLDKNIDKQIFLMYKDNIDLDLLTKIIYKILHDEKLES